METDLNIFLFDPKISISLEQTYDIIKQIVEGLTFLHNNNIVHRDIKSKNILLRCTKERVFAKLADFGISKEKSELDSDDFTLKGAGTLDYMSPELMNLNKFSFYTGMELILTL